MTIVMAHAKKIYAMLDNANLWDTAVSCHEGLKVAGVPHSVVGGVAVCLHGYQRNTTDLDLLIRDVDTDAARDSLINAGLQWNPTTKEFRSPSGIAVQILLSGDRAGKDSDVRLPDPSQEENVVFIDELPVLKLSKLIESKLACGTGSLRRTHKDFADVVELIAVRNLDSAFARHLHKSLRKTFRELVHRARES